MFSFMGSVFPKAAFNRLYFTNFRLSVERNAKVRMVKVIRQVTKRLKKE